MAGERAARAAALRADGWSLRRIGRVLGVSHQAVADCLAAGGRGELAAVAGPAPDTLLEDIARLVRDSPVFIPYEWRARRYPMAERALARAELIHGRPAA